MDKAKWNRKVSEWVTIRQNISTQLRTLARKMRDHKRRLNNAKLVGNATSIVGGVTAVVGFGLSVVTFGASLIVAGIGAGVAAAGGVTQGGCALTEMLIERDFMQDLQAGINSDQAHAGDLLSDLSEASDQIQLRVWECIESTIGKIAEVVKESTGIDLLAQTEDPDASTDNTLDMIKKKALSKETKIAVGNGMACRKVADAGFTVYDGVKLARVSKNVKYGAKGTAALAKAGEKGLAGGKGIFFTAGKFGMFRAVGGTVLSVGFLGWDVYTLAKTAIDKHKGDPCKVAKLMEDIADVYERHVPRL